jgi:hypothetical protein
LKSPTSSFFFVSTEMTGDWHRHPKNAMQPCAADIARDALRVYETCNLKGSSRRAMIMMKIGAPALFVFLFSCQFSSAQSAQGAKVNSKIYEFGKPTQQVTPRYIKESTRPDGSKTVVFGNTKSKPDKIGNPHGHTVRNPAGSLAYSRTIGGKVIYDDKKKK